VSTVSPLTGRGACASLPAYECNVKHGEAGGGGDDVQFERTAKKVAQYFGSHSAV
jgi:hypothetical protein